MNGLRAGLHGIQEMYQTLLGEQRHYGVTQKGATGIIFGVGAICGGTVIGHLSQKWGRRRSIILAAVFGSLLIPAWIFSPIFSLIVIGGFFYQIILATRWGVDAVHLKCVLTRGGVWTYPKFFA